MLVHALGNRRLLGSFLVRDSEENCVQKLTLDNHRQVFFYEQDHYYLSNFSAFKVAMLPLLCDQEMSQLVTFDTAEAAYHWFKFPHRADIQALIAAASSAHDALTIARKYNGQRMPDWDKVKVGCMISILRAKASQHEYVRRKLLETGERELIENSWRDNFWGWGPERNGHNMLGRLWVVVREDMRRIKGRETCNVQT